MAAVVALVIGVVVVGSLGVEVAEVVDFPIEEMIGGSRMVVGKVAATGTNGESNGLQGA